MIYLVQHMSVARMESVAKTLTSGFDLANLRMTGSSVVVTVWNTRSTRFNGFSFWKGQKIIRIHYLCLNRQFELTINQTDLFRFKMVYQKNGTKNYQKTRQFRPNHFNEISYSSWKVSILNCQNLSQNH